MSSAGQFFEASAATEITDYAQQFLNGLVFQMEEIKKVNTWKNVEI